MADYLQKEAGITAVLDAKGKMGELTVWVNDRLVARKGLIRFPARAEILAKIQAEMTAAES